VAELPVVLARAGFEQIEITRRFDCFLGTRKERTALKYGVMGVNVHARKLR
jgi:hypothetical protein